MEIMNFTDFKDKALQNLAVAEWCQENGHYDACCNRAYYAMYKITRRLQCWQTDTSPLRRLILITDGCRLSL